MLAPERTLIYRQQQMFARYRRAIRRWMFLCTLLAVLNPWLAGQDGSRVSTPESSPARNSISLHMVGTVANEFLEGTSRERRLFLLGAAWNHEFSRKKHVTFTLTSQIIPVALLREPFFVGTNIQAQINTPPFTEKRTTYGAGASPLGIKVDFLPKKRVHPFFGVQGGFLYFSETALSPQASHFNFTIDGRGGLEVPLSDGKDISFAYMFQHMSNAYIAHENPGVDCHMLTLAYRFPLRLGKKSDR